MPDWCLSTTKTQFILSCLTDWSKACLHNLSWCSSGSLQKLNMWASIWVAASFTLTLPSGVTTIGAGFQWIKMKLMTKLPTTASNISTHYDSSRVSVPYYSLVYFCLQVATRLAWLIVSYCTAAQLWRNLTVPRLPSLGTRLRPFALTILVTPLLPFTCTLSLRSKLCWWSYGCSPFTNICIW